jgi:hypothetical protein
VEEARKVLARLARIDSLEDALRRELEALAPEAEAWARAEGDERALRAAEALRRRRTKP